jgi:uncharacterized protein (DUF1330 family)
MTAYLVACYTITDPEGYAPYPAAVAPTLLAYGGELLVGDFHSHPLEGAPHPVTVVVKFPSRAAALVWYESPEYRAVVGLRTDHTVGTAVVVDEWVMPV